jgi:putative oxidoreductase
MAALFIYAGVLKVSGAPRMVSEFDHVGLGQWFRYFTGTLELAGAILCLIPRTSPYGAIALLAVDAGAFVAQITVLDQGWIHTIVIGLILSALIYFRRAAFRAGAV